MRVAIIGYSGFLGRFLSLRLLAQGHEVVGFGPNKTLDIPVPFYCFDATQNTPSFPAGTEVVFYLAQSPYYRQFATHGHHLFAVNALGPLTAAIAASQAGVKFFCFASTGNVYRASFNLLCENSPLNRTNPYGLSKLMGEESVALLSDTMQTMSIRLFGLFGPGQRAMLPFFLQNAVRNGEKIFLESGPNEPQPTGGMKISFLFAPDCARILSNLAEMALAGRHLPPVLNIAGPEGISIRDFAAQIGAIVGKSPVFTERDSLRQTDLIANISLLTTLVQPSFTQLSKALEETCGAQG